MVKELANRLTDRIHAKSLKLSALVRISKNLTAQKKTSARLWYPNISTHVAVAVAAMAL
jgi:hypothetical protein